MPPSSDTDLARREDALAALPDRERHALAQFAESRRYELSPALAERFYVLYLRGTSVEEIRRGNEQYSLGQLVHAKVRDDWDRRRREHADRLVAQARDNAALIGLESVEYISRRLTAIHQLDNQRIDRAITTGESSELNGLIGGNAEYGRLIDLLLKLTGQDRSHKLRLETSSPPAAVEGEYQPPPGPPAKGDLSPAQAAALLKILEEG